MSGIKLIFRDLGSVLIIVSVVNTFAIFIPIFYKEYDAIIPILLSSSILAVAGLIFKYVFGRTDQESKLRQAIAVAGFSWILIPLFTVLPFMMISELDFLSGFFESMSGWTTTGLTMFKGVEENISHTIQFYRSFTQWLGGIGVVVLTLTILPMQGSGSYNLFRSEAREDKIHPSVISTIRTMWWIYVSFTGIGIILLSIFGMPVWEALNHAMCAISTGGFTVQSESIGAYNSIFLEIIVLILMMFGATTFIANYNLFKGRFRKFFSDVQFQTLIALLILGIIGLSFSNLSFYNGNILESLRQSFFQFASSQTTTGYSTVSVNLWPTTSKLLMGGAMIIGGAAGATCGGIKLIRFRILLKKIKWRSLNDLSKPHRIQSYKIANKEVLGSKKRDVVNEAVTIFFLWLIFLTITIFILTIVTNYSLEDIVFETCSAQGNVGLSVGITNLSMNPLAKVMLLINMYIGRLEIIPVVMMIGSILKK
jgi:trk system potassium uptake protein